MQIKTKKKLHLFLFTLFLSACGGGGDTQNLENVIDIVRPVISSANSFTVSENQTSIGSAVASISDYSTLSYSLSGADADAISINSSTGSSEKFHTNKS